MMRKWNILLLDRKHAAKMASGALGVASPIFNHRHSMLAMEFDTIADNMFACCIFHNMILEDERDVPGLENVLGTVVLDNVALHRSMTLNQFTTHTEEIKNEDTHYALRGDLIEHLWALKDATMHD
jgi:hypothetical protein